MASSPSDTLVTLVGDSAGKVWHALHDFGPMSAAKLVKTVGLPRDAVMQAVGWLAREDKVRFHDEGRTRTIGLR